MVQQPIYENDAKNIIKRFVKNHQVHVCDFIIIDDVSKLNYIYETNSWLSEKKLVIKPDQCIKGRGLAGLVGLDFNWDQVCTWVGSYFGKSHKVGKAEGILNRFIVEPFIQHKKMDEHFLCIFSDKDSDNILYSSQGGIDIGDVNLHSVAINLKINEKPDINMINELVSSKTSSQYSSILIPFIVDMLQVFRDLHFTYLEFNPIIVVPYNSSLYIVDIAAKIDSCAEFVCAQKWQLCQYPPVFGRGLTQSELHILDLDSKSGASLKFTILNKNGRIWTMVAGGGASVAFSDTICDLGFSHELANYGEYSGAPTHDETYEYAITIMKLMVSSPKHSLGKILLIGGGIANFTNVAITFKGIIKALRKMSDKLIEHSVTVYVRRGGPNYEEGLKNISDACKELELPVFVFGIDVHMTSMVAMALGVVPITNTMEFSVSDTLSLPSKSVMNISSSITSNGTSFDAISDVHEMLFTNFTTSIIWGFQEVAIQGMLDFDYLSKRKTPSVSCMVYPFRASFISKFYFGLNEIFIPIFGSFEEATTKFPQASVLINFASMRSSYEISSEALNFPQFKLLSIFAEGIPERFTQMVNARAKEMGVTVIGPASIGGIKPGSFRIGHAGGIINNIFFSKLYRPGSVAYVTRSGGMSNELNNILARTTDGVYEGIHLGGDRYPGSSFMDHINRFNEDPNVELIVILGEVGGLEEYQVCSALTSKKIKKTIVAWCIGTCSSYFDTNIQFGHANACANCVAETAVAKNKCLKESGALVPESFDQLYLLISNTFRERVASGNWKIKPETSPPPIPVDYKYAREMGLIRKPSAFISTICDERGNEPTYSSYSISKILEQEHGIGVTIGLLWFQRLLSPQINRFLEMCIIILADHGPAVSGAHNTIVTARAGKDMLSSLCTGLLTIGDRFGGAINGAASQFWGAFCSKKLPADFVQEMRKKGELILGIGHMIKSVTNPDERVKKLIGYVKKIQKTPLLDYALQVEKITTSKKSNLILNVDGTIAVCLIDLLLQSDQFTEYSYYLIQFSEDINVYINLGAFNAIFILSRTIGFIGHYIDQKRLKQGLYRHPWDDISFIDRFDINK
ncbi:hypothetical protein MXB_5657 [Myxobolus squamalis]|nr:hypothetical protein MXB_5657 [Myxobolus squamalis]